MKTTFFIVAGSVLISFAACKKEGSKACYTCTVTNSFVANGLPIPLPPGTGVPPAEYCDKTGGDIETIEREGSSTQQFSLMGVSVVSTQKTTCVKN